MKTFLLLFFLSAQPVLATCVAFDGKSLAADSQITAGESKSFSTKIFKINDCYVACAGLLTDRNKFLKWFANQELAYPTVEKEFTALTLRSDGTCWQYWDTSEPVLAKPPSAIGSGSDAAVASMKLGATAKQAVKVASEIDLYTGGDIDCVEAEAGKKSK